MSNEANKTINNNRCELNNIKKCSEQVISKQSENKYCDAFSEDLNQIKHNESIEEQHFLLKEENDLRDKFLIEYVALEKQLSKILTYGGELDLQDFDRLMFFENAIIESNRNINSIKKKLTKLGVKETIDPEGIFLRQQ